MLTLPWIGWIMIGAGLFLAGIVAAGIRHAMRENRAARAYDAELAAVERDDLDPLPDPPDRPRRPVLPGPRPRFLPRPAAAAAAETTTVDGAWPASAEPPTARLRAEFEEWETDLGGRIAGTRAWFRRAFGDIPEVTR